MKKAMLFIAVALAGCATMEDVKRASTPELCWRAGTGRTGGLPASVLWREIAERGGDCSQQQGSINATLQQDANQTNMGLQLLQQAQPRPAPMPQQINCQTRYNGGVAYTSCQ